MSDEHRQKIANSLVLTNLIEHAEGKRDMKPSAVTAGLGLLKKILPDLATVELSGPDGQAVQAVHRIELVAVKAIDGRSDQDP